MASSKFLGLLGVLLFMSGPLTAHAVEPRPTFDSTVKSTAPATPSICDVYNDYIDQQCISKQELKLFTDPLILKSYDQKKCRTSSADLVLKTDEKLRSCCKIATSTTAAAIFESKTR